MVIDVLVDQLDVPDDVDGLCLAVYDDDAAGGGFGRSYRLHSDFERTLVVEPGSAESAQVLARGYLLASEVARARTTLDFSNDVSLTLPGCPPGRNDPAEAVASAEADGQGGLAVSTGRGGTWIVVVGTESAVFRATNELVAHDVDVPNAGTAPHQVLAFDADGDCDDDLLVLSSGGSPTLWRRDGLSGFTNDASAVPSGTGEWLAAAVADYDDDGDADVVVAGEAGAQLWRNDGSARFMTPDPAFNSDHASDALSIDAGDIDGDGDVDVVIGRGQQNPLPVRVHWNDGRGSFVPEVLDLGTPVQADAVLAHDFTGDGQAEVLVAPRAEAVRLFVAGSSGFEDQSDAMLPPLAERPVGANGFSVGKWTDDCLPDVGIAMGAASHVQWRARSGGVLVADGTGAAARWLVLTDVDDDGDGDLVSLGASGLWWWRRQGE